MSIPKSFAVTPEELTAPNRIYCDVDGVLALFIMNYEGTLADYNALGDAQATIDILVNLGWGEPEIRSTELRWNSDSVKALSDLSKRDDIDFVWVTAWRNHAPEHLDTLWDIRSAGHLPWANKMPDHGHVFKSVAIDEAEAVSPSKFVWIDDFAITADRIKRIRKTNNNFITIETDHQKGITLKHITKIQQFFDGGKA